MREGIFARMVARAMPPHITDSNQRRVAAEAAENAIRQTAWFAGIVGVLLLVLAGGMLYRRLPSPQSSPARVEPSKVVGELAGEVATLREENEELQKKLGDVTRELQGKVKALEGQVADLTAKLHAAERAVASGHEQAEAVKETPLSLRPATGSGGTRAAVSPPGVYQCGDGRRVRDAAACRNTAMPAASEARREPSGVYQCGDGRTTRDPAGCLNTGTPSGR